MSKRVFIAHKTVFVVDGNEVLSAEITFEILVADYSVGVMRVTVSDEMMERKLTFSLFQNVVGDALNTLVVQLLETKLIFRDFFAVSVCS